MYKRILIVLIVFSLAEAAYSQNVRFGYQTGFGKYAMGTLKSINTQVSESLPFDTKVVDDFPGYLYFRPGVSLEYAKYTIGLICSFQSTGSRVSAKDFSGEFRFDTKVSSIAPGIYGDYEIYSFRKSRLSFYSMAGLVFTKLKTHELLTLQSTQVQDQDIDLKAQDYFLEPGVTYSYSIGSFSLALNTGYFISLGSEAFYTGSNKKNILHNNKNQDVKPDWNGIRAGFSIFYTIRPKQ